MVDRTSLDPKSVASNARLKRLASESGLDVVGVAKADAIPSAPQRLKEFLEQGRQGSMGWLEERAHERSAPQNLWPSVRSVIMVGQNYGPDENPLDLITHPEKGAISVYARGRDYHDVVKGKLKTFASKIISAWGGEVKVFVDTAPVMEKPLAAAAGIGWQGKHTNLVSRDFGSWLFLGAIFTTLDLSSDEPQGDHCGACEACLAACPTDAFPSPYKLDARRCISYLTIEHKDPIPHELRPLMGNRIYGCDDCLAVCPWNKFAQQAAEQKLAARAAMKAPDLAELARMDDMAFRQFFSGSPIKRTGRDRFIRNVMIAIGNSNDVSLFEAAMSALKDRSPLVRGAAIWAVRRLAPPEELRAIKEKYEPGEVDDIVRQEWSAPLGR